MWRRSSLRRSARRCCCTASWHWVFAVLVVLAGALLLRGRAGAARDAAAVAPQAAAGARHRRDLRRNCCATSGSSSSCWSPALGMSGLFAYIAGASFVLQGHLRPRPAGLRAGVRRRCGRADRRDAVQRRAAEAVLAAGDHAVGAGRRTACRRGVRRPFGWPTSVGWPVSWCRCGRSWPRWAWSSPTRPPSRCPGTPTPRAPRPRCWVPRSSASAPRWRPLVGVLGNDELALSIVMTVSVLVALVRAARRRRLDQRGRRRHRCRGRRRRSGVVVPAEIRPYRQSKLLLICRRAQVRSLRSFVKSLRTGRLRGVGPQNSTPSIAAETRWGYDHGAARPACGWGRAGRRPVACAVGHDGRLLHDPGRRDDRGGRQPVASWRSWAPATTP